MQSSFCLSSICIHFLAFGVVFNVLQEPCASKLFEIFQCAICQGKNVGLLSLIHCSPIFQFPWLSKINCQNFRTALKFSLLEKKYSVKDGWNSDSKKMKVRGYNRNLKIYVVLTGICTISAKLSLTNLENFLLVTTRKH